MSFFRRGDAHAQARSVLRDLAVKNRERNAREARSAGFPVDGARYVLFERSLSGTTSLAIRDGQVEHYAKDSGSIFDSEHARTVIPWALVSDVGVASRGGETVLTITGPDGPVSIRTRTHEVEYAAGLIEELRGSPSASTEAGRLPPVEALAQLSAMHERGLVSDEEFVAKRAEILDRL